MLGGLTRQDTTGNHGLPMNPKRKPIFIVYDASRPAGGGQRRGAVLDHLRTVVSSADIWS